MILQTPNSQSNRLKRLSVSFIISVLFILFELSIFNLEYLLFGYNISPNIMKTIPSGTTILFFFKSFIIIQLLCTLILSELIIFFKNIKFIKTISLLYKIIYISMFIYAIVALPFFIKNNIYLRHVNIFQPQNISDLISTILVPHIFFRILSITMILIITVLYPWDLFFKKIYFHLFNEEFVELHNDIMSSDNFISNLNTIISNTKRLQKPIALMGFKIKKEVEIIKDYGNESYYNIIDAIHKLTSEISRKGEDQILYQTNIILSVVYTDEINAKVVAKRFYNKILPELKKQFHQTPIELSIGIFGIDFSNKQFSELDEATLSDKLLWGVVDNTSEAQEKENIIINFLEDED